jgi:hypothetical protein
MPGEFSRLASFFGIYICQLDHGSDHGKPPYYPSCPLGSVKFSSASNAPHIVSHCLVAYPVVSSYVVFRVDTEAAAPPSHQRVDELILSFPLAFQHCQGPWCEALTTVSYLFHFALKNHANALNNTKIVEFRWISFEGRTSLCGYISL